MPAVAPDRRSVVSAVDSTRPMSTVAAVALVPLEAVRKFWVALKSAASGWMPGRVDVPPKGPTQKPGWAMLLSP